MQTFTSVYDMPNSTGDTPEPVDTLAADVDRAYSEAAVLIVDGILLVTVDGDDQNAVSKKATDIASYLRKRVRTSETVDAQESVEIMVRDEETPYYQYEVSVHFLNVD
jgi:hypothetical protein